jgi:hypothetical protein
MNQEDQDATPLEGMSRRNMFAIGSALATAAFAPVSAHAVID